MTKYVVGLEYESFRLDKLVWFIIRKIKMSHFPHHKYKCPYKSSIYSY